jgi:REP element-mobilizing transposase RayT
MTPEEPSPGIDRVKFELRAEGVKPGQTSPLRSGIHSRGYLPHVKHEGSRYFVTFRLADSMPEEVFIRIKAWRAERLTAFYAQQETAREHGTTPPNPEVLTEIERDYHRKLEEHLDKGYGECWLRRPDIADLVAGALRFFDGQRYHLHAWVIMPGHIHAVFWPMPNHTLSEIAKTWKTFSARQANKTLSRTGQRFWQPEPFDHWIRNDEEHERCCNYVIRNPVKARLCAAPEDWRWSSAWRGRLSS